jgi:HPt (histidine-containing phosphotransfer) domain-containing protein
VSTLRMILHSFVKGYREGSPELLAAATHRDTVRLAQACHALRGACAAIGAAALQHELLAMELAAGQAAPPDPQLMARAQALNTRLAALAAHISEALRGGWPRRASRCLSRRKAGHIVKFPHLLQGGPP